MKIENNTQKHIVTVGSLKYGEIFQVDNTFYIKISQSEICISISPRTNCYCVDLETGKITIFRDDSCVSKVNCKLVIEGNE